MPIPAHIDGWLPPGVHACTLDEIEETLGVATDQRRLIMRALREHCQSVYVRQYGQHLLVDGGFLSTKPSPKDADIVVGLRRGSVREILTGQVVNVRTIMQALEGAHSPRVRGHLLIHGFADDVGGAKYQSFRDYFQQSDRDDEPPVKGILRVDL